MRGSSRCSWWRPPAVLRSRRAEALRHTVPKVAQHLGAAFVALALATSAAAAGESSLIDAVKNRDVEAERADGRAAARGGCERERGAAERRNGADDLRPRGRGENGRRAPQARRRR